MSYQSTHSQKGDSDTIGKLKALDIPVDLSGKSFLDLGCNEGFFCNEAKSRGASRVVGVDQNKHALDIAKQKYSGIDFRNESWWSFDDSEKFDYIILTSAIHYEKNPRDLCEKIKSMLNDGGVFILEAGVLMDDDTSRWHAIQRHDGVFRYPTFPLLRDFILPQFAVRHVGPSVKQAGDPIPRHVVHCTHLEAMVLLISGHGKVGKTILSNMLSKANAPTINIDNILLNISSSRGNFPEKYKEFIEFIREDIDSYRLDIAYSRLDKSNFTEEFAEMIIEYLAIESPLTILEGYPLRLNRINDSIVSALKKAGFRPWSCSPSF